MPEPGGPVMSSWSPNVVAEYRPSSATPVARASPASRPGSSPPRRRRGPAPGTGTSTPGNRPSGTETSNSTRIRSTVSGGRGRSWSRARRSSRRRGAARTRWPCRVWPTAPPRRSTTRCVSSCADRSRPDPGTRREVRPDQTVRQRRLGREQVLGQPCVARRHLPRAPVDGPDLRMCAGERVGQLIRLAMTTLHAAIVSVAVEPGRTGNPASAGVVRGR